MGISTSVSNGSFEDTIILLDGPVLQEDVLGAQK